MSEVDDRLAGDPMWELFPDSTPAAVVSTPRSVAVRRWLVLAAAVVAAWFLYPPAAVLVACIAVAAPELRKGWRLRRSIPDKAGGSVCARFAYAWGCLKLGGAASMLMFAALVAGIASDEPSEAKSFVAFVSIHGPM